jgi:diketogulonate reductase-like aldo/keto reductase
MAQIAQGHPRTSAQVVVRSALEVGMVPLPGTTDDGRMRGNHKVSNFRLGPEEAERIEGLAVLWSERPTCQVTDMSCP